MTSEGLKAKNCWEKFTNLLEYRVRINRNSPAESGRGKLPRRRCGRDLREQCEGGIVPEPAIIK